MIVEVGAVAYHFFDSTELLIISANLMQNGSVKR